MKQEELNEILRLHKMWVEGKDGGAQANLEGADLRGAYLEGANLRGAGLCMANLEGANLREANLRGARLLGANLRFANLIEANLRGAHLREANLRGALLSEAHLEGTDLRGANLRGAHLREANLIGANLDYACWPLWCGSLAVTVDSKIAAQLVYHAVRACQSVTDDADIVALCKNPELIKLANRFHRADECGRIEAAEGDAK